MAQRILDIATYIGAIIGGLFVYTALFTDASAPQQGALAAVGIAFAVIPYVISATEHRAAERRKNED